MEGHLPWALEDDLDMAHNAHGRSYHDCSTSVASLPVRVCTKEQEVDMGTQDLDPTVERQRQIGAMVGPKGVLRVTEPEDESQEAHDLLMDKPNQESWIQRESQVVHYTSVNQGSRQTMPMGQ